MERSRLTRWQLHPGTQKEWFGRPQVSLRRPEPRPRPKRSDGVGTTSRAAPACGPIRMAAGEGSAHLRNLRPPIKELTKKGVGLWAPSVATRLAGEEAGASPRAPAWESGGSGRPGLSLALCTTSQRRMGEGGSFSLPCRAGGAALQPCPSTQEKAVLSARKTDHLFSRNSSVTDLSFKRSHSLTKCCPC